MILDTSYAAFIQHVRPVIYLSVRLPNHAHCRFAHHLERTRLGIVCRNFAAVFTRTYEYAAFCAGLDVSICPDKKIIVVSAAIQPFLEPSWIELASPVNIHIVRHEHLFEPVVLKLGKSTYPARRHATYELKFRAFFA